jgi:hypothetical protein
MHQVAIHEASHRFDYRVAIHESGHVTVGRALGMPVCGATINFFDGHFGRTWSDASDLQDGAETVESICARLAPLMPEAIAAERLQLHHSVMELLGGAEAERLFSDTMLPNTTHDLQEATCIARLIVRSPSSVDAYLASARAEVVALLIEHTAAVFAVADALIERRALTGEQIDRAISRAAAA